MPVRHTGEGLELALDCVNVTNELYISCGAHDLSMKKGNFVFKHSEMFIHQVCCCYLRFSNLVISLHAGQGQATTSHVKISSGADTHFNVRNSLVVSCTEQSLKEKTRLISFRVFTVISPSWQGSGH